MSGQVTQPTYGAQNGRYYDDRTSADAPYIEVGGHTVAAEPVGTILGPQGEVIKAVYPSHARPKQRPGFT